MFQSDELQGKNHVVLVVVSLLSALLTSPKLNISTKNVSKRSTAACSTKRPNRDGRVPSKLQQTLGSSETLFLFRVDMNRRKMFNRKITEITLSDLKGAACFVLRQSLDFSTSFQDVTRHRHHSLNNDAEDKANHTRNALTDAIFAADLRARGQVVNRAEQFCSPCNIYLSKI